MAQTSMAGTMTGKPLIESDRVEGELQERVDERDTTHAAREVEACGHEPLTMTEPTTPPSKPKRPSEVSQVLLANTPPRGDASSITS